MSINVKYKKTLEYLFNQLPMYQRIGKAAYKVNLDNTIALCNALGNPEDGLVAIHVAGTNGKGSVSHILASIFQEAGYKTGLYTSPHLIDFRERIKINGKCISKEHVCNFVETNKSIFEKIKPSFFEMTVSMALKYFKEEKTDIAIIETGLGGRLDSTNIITPLISVITNIGFDHTQFLGNTLEKIAIEKAGIIKKKIPVIIGESHAKTSKTFIETAKRNKSAITFSDQNYLCSRITDDTNKEFNLSIHNLNSDKRISLNCPLSANYQLKNLTTVYTTIQELNKNKKYFIQEKHLKKGIENIVANTAFKGRWQILKSKPKTICDLAHNVEGIKELLNNIKDNNYLQLHIIIGFVDDKSVDEILTLLPTNANYYFCKANISRALDSEILFNMAKRHNLNGTCFSTVTNALKSAKSNADKKDLIIITGSTFVVAEIV